MTTTILHAMWQMGRTRLTGQLPLVIPEVLPKRLHPNSNSAGFLLRHIAEVEQLFAKNVFGLPITVKVQTVGKSISDTGKFTQLEPLLEELKRAEEVLSQAILRQADEAWVRTVTTAEFGTVTQAEALARIMTHTAYHAGQLALIIKYGA